MEELVAQIKDVSRRLELMTQRKVKARQMFELLKDNVPVCVSMSLTLPAGTVLSLEKLPFSFVAVGNGTMAFLANVLAQFQSECASLQQEYDALLQQLKQLGVDGDVNS